MTNGRPKGHLYFIGITGHTMRGLALAARELGYEVTGLDEPAIPPGSTWVSEHGFTWWREFEPGQLDGVTAVIVTGAYATNDYPAIIEARRRNIEIKSYAQLWGELTAGERVIAVAGTAGKTTTSALIAWLLESAGRRPDFLIGVRPNNFDASVRLAGARIAVAEGDEYRASPLETKSKVQYHHPDVLVLTSVEHDHPDFFPDLASVQQRFGQIVRAVPEDGRLIACADHINVMAAANAARCPVTTYGLRSADTTPDYTAVGIAFQPGGLEFNIVHRGHDLGRLATGLYGRHNVANTLAAVAAASSEGLTFEQITAAASTFKGTYRRFTLVTPANAPTTIIDDYAHHPTKVMVTLEAAKLHFPGRRVVAVFRPHTYSRTAALLSDYHHAFDHADEVYVTDIEGARETGAEHSVSGQDIVDGLAIAAHYAPNRTKLVERLKATAKPGDVIVCMTVSSYGNLAEELAATLNYESPATPTE